MEGRGCRQCWIIPFADERRKKREAWSLLEDALFSLPPLRFFEFPLPFLLGHSLRVPLAVIVVDVKSQIASHWH